MVIFSQRGGAQMPRAAERRPDRLPWRRQASPGRWPPVFGERRGRPGSRKPWERQRGQRGGVPATWTWRGWRFFFCASHDKATGARDGGGAWPGRGRGAGREYSGMEMPRTRRAGAPQCPTREWYGAPAFPPARQGEAKSVGGQEGFGGSRFSPAQTLAGGRAAEGATGARGRGRASKPGTGRRMSWAAEWLSRFHWLRRAGPVTGAVRFRGQGLRQGFGGAHGAGHADNLMGIGRESGLLPLPLPRRRRGALAL